MIMIMITKSLTGLPSPLLHRLCIWHYQRPQRPVPASQQHAEPTQRRRAGQDRHSRKAERRACGGSGELQNFRLDSERTVCE